MRFSFLMFLALTILSPILAQDDIPIFATPEKLFSEYVEIIALEYLPETVFFMPDDTQKIVTYYDLLTSTTKQYPYPSSVTRIFEISADAQKKLYFSVNIENKGEIKSEIWTFHPASEQFQKFEGFCFNNAQLQLSEIMQKPWLILRGEDERFHLCNILTGETSEPLPEGIDWFVPSSPGYILGVSVSPDQQWLAFLGCNPNDLNCMQPEVYSYHLLSRTIKHLGNFKDRKMLTGFVRWVGSQFIIETSEMGEYHTRLYVIADANRENSVEAAFGQYRFYADFYDNPPRFEFTTGWADGDFAKACGWVIYDISTRTLSEFDMKTLCRPDRGLPKAGDGYYRQRSAETSEIVELVRYNPITGEYAKVYEGEIEEVVWVSDDGRYAFLTMDSSGRVDASTDIVSSYWGVPSTPRLSLVDLTTGKTLYSQPTLWEFGTSLVNNPDGSIAEVLPLSHNSWIVLDREKPIELGEPTVLSATRLTLIDGQIMAENLLEKVIDFTPDKKGVLFRQDDNGVSYYHFATGDTFPILQPLNSEQYFTNVEINEQIQIRVIHNGKYQTFTIRILTDKMACQLTTLQGVNFRAQPNAEAEKVGSALADSILEANGQMTGNDGFIWWRLVDAQGWVRQDLVAESEGCITLPVVF